MLTDLLVGALRTLPVRGKLQLLNTFIPHQGERTCQAFGCRFRVDLGDPAHRRLYAGDYETGALRALARMLSPGGSFVDANAGIGLLTAMAAQRIGPTGQIAAAESRPMSYLRLEAMVRDNHLNNVVLHNGSFGGRDGHSTRTLDSLAADHGIHHIDLLKIGDGDLSLLAGAARLLASRRIGAIVCEIAAGADSRILEQVSVLGFRLVRRWPEAASSYHLFRVV